MEYTRTLKKLSHFLINTENYLLKICSISFIIMRKNINIRFLIMHIYNLNPASRYSVSVTILCKDMARTPFQVRSKINLGNAVSHFS